MIRRFIHIIVLLTIIISEASAINVRNNNNKIAGETLEVRASSASVLRWFRYIEQQCNITISFNQSNINLQQTCTISYSSRMTVGELLSILLKDYKFVISELPERKLAIRIDAIPEYTLSGHIKDKSNAEKLLGAVLCARSNDGKTQYTISNNEGYFCINLKEGEYMLEFSYMGFKKLVNTVNLNSNKYIDISLQPASFSIDEVTVQTTRSENELSEISPSGMLSFNGNDLFSQIWILPGITGTPTGNNYMVDGGGYDENLVMLDGVPMFHPGHVNALLPQFNGDVIKNIVFHKGFFPTRLEGGLSSMTEFNLKEGNKKEHCRTISLDMPAASLTLEGPIVKDKLSYIAGVRRSWLDLFDQLLSDEQKMNHYSLDVNGKLSYSINDNNSLSFLAYTSFDEYRLPLFTQEAIPVVKWNNQLYKLSYHRSMGKITNTSSISYSSFNNKALSDVLGIDNNKYTENNDEDKDKDEVTDDISDINEEMIGNGIKTINASSEFSYSPENIYTMNFGVKYSHEEYSVQRLYKTGINETEKINQYSLYHDNLVRLNNNLSARVGIHFVAYCPVSYKNYYSIQPRFSLNYMHGNNNLFYFTFSKMEQFYHYISFNGIALPTDFRMPSIKGYKPRSSSHIEIGYKRNFYNNNGKLEISSYYKTRKNVIALKPMVTVEDNDWNSYLMNGDGDSYGIKMYLYWNINKWIMQCSYTYSRSREWFVEYEKSKKLPSLYDIPHYGAGAITYNINHCSSFSLGCIMKSGRIIATDNWIETEKQIGFRNTRDIFNYRIDLGYTYKKDLGNKQLLLRCGLYNLLGNPPEEDVINFYSVHLSDKCLPYGSISFRF